MARLLSLLWLGGIFILNTTCNFLPVNRLFLNKADCPGIIIWPGLIPDQAEYI
ncbi:MAG: hypothetical protein AVDCRST_MAG95-3663 [uncultured Adhaeribacter sp.]|uniref:Uncharacterized protein n=1 Tax=uncultured Adhaeribacter sp. TaxID=448109 RepID=A0A6J4JSC4_9BACT|nr:MAG: hypothetical protein AVDCRST_MAG95-3663 [uncultured Adhaeribacter sp.]